MKINEASIDKALLAYCKATGLNYVYSAVLREAIRQTVRAYLEAEKK
jgi:hypothetical protein